VRHLKIKEIKSKKSVEQSTARTAAAKANAQNPNTAAVPRNQKKKRLRGT